MQRGTALGLIAACVLSVTVPLGTRAQSSRVYRVGVIHQGGSYLEAVAGLRDGLKEPGWEEGKQYLLHVRDTKGDFHAVEAAARSLESEKVDLICAFATSVTLSAKQATKSVPIVFHVGTNPET